MDGYPGLYRDLLTYLRERIKEVLTGASATIVVRLFGPDLERLQRDAEAGPSGDGASRRRRRPEGRSRRCWCRRSRCGFGPSAPSAFGLDAGDVRRAATTLMQGTKVGEFYEEQKILRRGGLGRAGDASEPRRRARAADGDARQAATVPLADVADVAVVPAPNEIKRENGSRRIDVTCNVSGRDLGTVAREIEARLAGVSLRDRLSRRNFSASTAARARVESPAAAVGLAWRSAASC